MQYSNRNLLYLSAPKLEHMTLVVKPLRLNKAQGKRRNHASIKLSVIIVPTKHSCHLKVQRSLQSIS